MATGCEAESRARPAECDTETITTRHYVTESGGEITTGLNRHPDRSLPGVGATFTVETSVRGRRPALDVLASAASPAPVLPQSGKIRYLRRSAATGNGLALVRQFTFCSIHRDPASRACHASKHTGNRDHQVLVVVARRQDNVLLRTRQAYRGIPIVPAAGQRL